MPIKSRNFRVTSTCQQLSFPTHPESHNYAASFRQFIGHLMGWVRKRSHVSFMFLLTETEKPRTSHPVRPMIWWKMWSIRHSHSTLISVLINSRVVSHYVRNVRSVCPDGEKKSKEKNTSASRLTPKSELYDRNVNGLLGNWLVKKFERSKDEHAIRKLEQRLLDGFVCVYVHVTHSNHG